MEPSEAEEPPDSFRQNRAISVLGPKERIGSFFVEEKIEVITDIGRCFELWQEFSPQKSLFDTWEFRFAFYKGYKHKPHFLLLKNRFENLALLPLWHDSDKKTYTWFGSDWQEEVRFFVKSPKYIPALLSAAPSPLFLNAIAQDSIDPIKGLVNFEEDDPKYFLNLEKLTSHENYLMNLKKNRRHNLRKDKRKIEGQNPEIIINNFADIKHLIELSKKRFGDKDQETDWEDPRRIETFNEVIKLSGRSYQARMITIKIGGRIAGVDLVCIHKKTYFAVKCGYDVQSFSGIGNFMNLLEIDDAIKLGMKKIDFLQNDYDWKDRYFQSLSLFKYKKHITPTDIKLRRFLPSDLKNIMKLETASFSSIDAYSEERFSSLYEKYANDFIVAEKYNDIIGYIMTYEKDDFVDFNSIAVAKEYRGLGIGKLLIDSALERFRKRGIKKALLQVRLTNETALSFYLNLGFKILRVNKNYYKDEGDACHMEKIIN